MVSTLLNASELLQLIQLKEHDSDQDAAFDLLGDAIVDRLPLKRDPHELDILIVTSDIKDSLDEVGELNTARGKAIRGRETSVHTVNRILPSPSGGVHSFSAIKALFQSNGDHFHAGRPDGNYGPPVALFNPVLGLLAYRLSHLDDNLPEIRPDHHESKLVHEFISRSLNCYDGEDQRQIAVQSFVPWLDPDNVEWKRRINNITPDWVFGAATGFPYGIEEDQNEVGLGGDASTQARLSYTKITKRIRKRSNCPAVVIGLMGDMVEIGITSYIDGPYSDYVFSSGRMRLGFHQNEQVFRIARAFKAVKLAFADLRRFYLELDTNPPPNMSIQHLFPSPVPEPSWQGHMPSITFTYRMSCIGELFIVATTADQRRSGIYVGTMLKVNPTLDAAEQCLEVLVKFTAADNDSAHRILADAGLAPTLHTCVPVCGDLKMVVMDRLQGEMAWSIKARGEPLPPTLYEDVRSAIDLLHCHDLVFGDLRLPNIMYVPSRSAGDFGVESKLRAMLVDFDWVGKADEARYPAILNDGLGDWAPGADRCAIMRKEHDLYMLEEVRAVCRSIPE
ncbi:hypothetical protein L226DRAFT_565364 [Lentinus tigrinus ALCF2SS1-7]|uniref:Protein kinase domain-containing protein n=1 Tax=Lentinus tigrinus ALCF2SS1-6 TaxID=1328759 RepID=A0A5C2SM04_9APHY|nr:hypothetical protein L227DRAFT_607303 [Lentinus tigrinus ALCF2SS1-6]RPD82837.1 hypothetical protein L226DRAFT_565364 [Lentinus tigrinus ALCF2SS1-7]